MNSIDPSCLFCKIILGEIPGTKVYEDDNILAFLDINPVNLGHTLVVPKKHSKNIYNISDEEVSALIKIGKKIAEALQRAGIGDGVNLIMNNEKTAGQLIFHTHLHVIPRLENDGFRHWRGKGFSREEIEKTGEKIKVNLIK